MADERHWKIYVCDKCGLPGHAFLQPGVGETHDRCEWAAGRHVGRWTAVEVVPASTLEAAEKSREHCEYWYAVRFERLRDLTRDRSKAAEPGSEMAQVWADIASILANGTLGPPDHPYEPPTYAQQLNIAKHRAEAAESRCRELEEALKGLTTDLAVLAGEEKSRKLWAEERPSKGRLADMAAARLAVYADVVNRLREIARSALQQEEADR